MMKQKFQNINIKIALAAVAVAAILGCMTLFFVNEVEEQLWEQSVSTIMESTRQGGTTLRVQLHEEQQSMNVVAGYLSMLDAGQTDLLDESVESYGKVNRGISLYFTDGVCYPSGEAADEEAVKALSGMDWENGVIDPHINSVTGVNVFNLYTKVTLRDGTEGYLLKEYEIDSIVDTFSISFYNDAGFSYVMDTKGTILIRPPHPNSNKTVRNLFDMLVQEENSEDSLERFRESLEASRTGWATFNYMDEATVFCYIPLGLGSDWYLISIIPQAVVNAQTNEILTRTMLLIGIILLGIALLVAMYFRYVSRTNRRLRSQADYISHLYNAVPEGIALVTLDEPYRFLQLNREGRHLLGYSQAPLQNSLEEEKLSRIICPQDYERIAQILHDTAFSGVKNQFECRVAKTDGSFFWIAGLVEKTLDEAGSPILIATFHDITEEKLAEEEAEREKRQERILLVSAISSVYPVIVSLNLTRDTLKFIYIQQGLMVRIGEQKTYSELYQGFIKLIHPGNAEEFRRRFAPENLLDRLGQDRNEVFLEARQMMTDGQYHWISIQIISIENPYSDDKLAILISRRIDEQRYEEEQQRQALQSALENAKAASEAKSRFLSNMSHDIRTPMNAIVGMTAIAASHLDDRERVAECLEKISFSSSHLLSLINDILDMSKIESGKLSLAEEPFNLAKLISDVVELVRPQAESGGLKLLLRQPVLKNKMVTGDPLRIRQVYLNILSNAVKYTPRGGSVTIEAEQEASRQKGYRNYVFHCTDTGIGMSGEFLQRLYQPFEREEGADTRKVTGTGLGMAITKNIIDMMGGDIHVKSGLGEGTKFTVTLPLLLQETGQEEVTSGRQSLNCGDSDENRQGPDDLGEDREADEALGLDGGPVCSGSRVLLVEDNALNREIARILIEETGAVVEEACDGAEAVQMVADSDNGYYGIIFMDIQMPVMDGYEAAKAIRRLNRTDAPDIPIVAMTANAFEEDIRAALRAGMNAHFAKPIDVKELEKLLRRYLCKTGEKESKTYRTQENLPR